MFVSPGAAVWCGGSSDSYSQQLCRCWQQHRQVHIWLPFIHNLQPQKHLQGLTDHPPSKSISHVSQVPAEPGCALQRSHGPASFPRDSHGCGHPHQETTRLTFGTVGVEAALLDASGRARPGGGGPAHLPHFTRHPSPGKQRNHRG